jgi:hypothetical protein
VSLPTEILLRVLRSVEQNDLLSLSRLSKRLHYLALSLYFERHDIKNLRDGIFASFVPGESCLPGLRIALFVDTTVQLDFRFRSFPDGIIKDMPEAIYLVSKFSRVESVGLNFGSIYMWPSGRSLCTGPEHDNLTIFSQHLARLFSALRKRSCVSLSIHWPVFKTRREYDADELALMAGVDRAESHARAP